MSYLVPENHSKTTTQERKINSTTILNRFHAIIAGIREEFRRANTVIPSNSLTFPPQFAQAFRARRGISDILTQADHNRMVEEVSRNASLSEIPSKRDIFWEQDLNPIPHEVPEHHHEGFKTSDRHII